MKKEDKSAVEENEAIREMATTGVSSRILFLLLAYGPLKHTMMQSLLHPDSSGSSQISNVLKELLKLGLIDCVKKPHKEFKSLETIKMSPDNKWKGILLTNPVYSPEDSVSTTNFITSKWLSPLYPKLSDSQENFIRKTFERYAKQPSINKMSFKRDFDLYQLLENAINDLIIKRAVGKVLLGIDSEYLEQLNSRLMPRISDDGLKEFFAEAEKLLEKRNIPITMQSKQLVLELISTPYELSTKELLELAEPFASLPLHGKKKHYKYSFVQGCYVALLLEKHY